MRARRRVCLRLCGHSHRGLDKRGIVSCVVKSPEEGAGDGGEGWTDEKTGRLTVRFQLIMRKNSRSRTLSSVTGIPPTFA